MQRWIFSFVLLFTQLQGSLTFSERTGGFERSTIMRSIKLVTEARFAKFGESLQTVALPHTWNNLDGQDGGNDYWRGIGTYEIDLPNPTPGMKQYIEL